MDYKARQTPEGKTIFINEAHICYKVNDPYPVTLDNGDDVWTETLWFSNGQRYSFIRENDAQINEDAK